jgi:hypothetical protein
VEVEGTTVTVKSGETVDVKAGKPVTVDEGVTFMVPANSAVSVGSGAEFIVKGAVAVESGGSFTVEESGTANVEGVVAVEGGGSFSVGNSGTANVTGTVAVESNGSFSVGNNGTANVEGTVAVESGGNFTVEENGMAAVSGQLTVGSGNTLSNNVNSYNANYQAAAGGNGISALEAEIGDGKLAVKSGGTLEVSTGKITVNSGGILDVAGIINVGGKVEVAGTIVYQDGSSGNLTGTITVTSTGTSKDLKAGGGSIIASDGGESVVQAGAKVYNMSGGALVLLIGPTTDAILQLAPGATFGPGYKLEGNATLNETFGIDENKIFTIKNGKLTVQIKKIVAPGSQSSGLWVIGPNAKIVGEGNAAVEVQAPSDGVTSGLLYFSAGGVSNFYNSDGSQITAQNPHIAIGVGIYDWNPELGGNAGGWKAQAGG